MSSLFPVSSFAAKPEIPGPKPRNACLKGQSSLEMLVTVAALLAYSLPIVLLVFSFSYMKLEDVALTQGRATVQQLSDGVNSVYLQGEGARHSMLIDLPSGTRNLTVSGKTITLYISATGGTYSISHPIFANASSFTISDRVGLIKITMRMEGGQVILE